MNAKDNVDSTDRVSPEWKDFLRIGGYASLLTLALGIFEIMLTFLPGGDVDGLDTIVDWFNFFDDNPFMGLRTFGLVNFGLVGSGIVVMVALYGALQNTNRGWITLAAVLSFMGAGIFFSTNRAFPMLVLSNDYAEATTDSERAKLEAAGEVMVAVGQSHAPGTFWAYVLSSVSTIIVGAVMLRTDLFSNRLAYIGIAAFICFLIFEVAVSLFPSMFQSFLLLAGVGGILTMIWQGMLGLRLMKLAQSS